jgi:hypothetical protein
MRFILLAFVAAFGLSAYGDTPDISIPARYIDPIKTTDFVEVTGTNDMGGHEDFTIHNAKAIAEFVHFLTAERYNAAPKSLQPDFKSRSAYDVRLSSKGAPVLEFKVIADSVLDIPGESSFYLESDRHSDNLMAPLLRLR